MICTYSAYSVQDNCGCKDCVRRREMNDYTISSEVFRNYRKSKGWTRKQMAERLGVSASSIEIYESGVRREDGRAVTIPKYVAIIIGLWNEIDHSKMVYERSTRK